MNRRANVFGAMCLAIGVLLWSGTGCVTYQDQRTRQAVEEREDLLLLQQEIRALRGQVEGLELETERLRRNFTQVQEDQRLRDQALTRETETRISELDRRITGLDRAREQDRKEIIERLSQTIEQVVARSRTPARTSTPRQTHSGYGYEHVVGPGETLSHIASAYGVTTRSIVDANNISNPNVLQVGQTLFIPE